MRMFFILSLSTQFCTAGWNQFSYLSGVTVTMSSVEHDVAIIGYDTSYATNAPSYLIDFIWSYNDGTTPGKNCVTKKYKYND